MKIIAVVSPRASLKNAFEDNLQPVTIHGKSVCMALINIPTPQFNPLDELSKDLVLIRKHAFSLNFRDAALIFSVDSYLRNKPETLHFFAIGSEFVGTIDAVGSNVHNFQIGDRVIADAAYPHNEHSGITPGIPTNSASKEYEVFHQSKLMLIPPSLPDEEAAGFMVGAQTAFSMIRRSGIISNETCLITAGSSNTSLFLIIALQRKGVRIVVLTTNSQNVNRLLDLGVQRVVVVERGQSLQKSEAFQKMMREESKFDVVFDPYSDIYAGQIMASIAMNGRYVTCGIYNQYSSCINEDFEYIGESPTTLMARIVLNNICVIGNCLGTTQDLKDALDAYDAGHFHVMIDSVYTPDELSDFFDQTFNNRARFGKVIMKYL